MDLLRELGGVTFLYNLSKSSIVHSDVKETALFTLGTLAEANGGYLCFKGYESITYFEQVPEVFSFVVHET